MPKPAIRSFLIVAAMVLAACSAATTATTSPPAPATLAPDSTLGQSPASTHGAGSRPIVIDTDMGADDILALAILLREPSVAVKAVTVTGTGLTHCEAGVQNLANLLSAFETDVPIGCGRDDAGDDGLPFPPIWRTGTDAFHGIELEEVADVEQGEATQVLSQAIADSPAPVTIVALGAWTSLEDLFAAHPSLLANVEGIHAMGGAIDVPGNVGPESPAEWNIRNDPSAVAGVFETDVSVTLIPLDATNAVPLNEAFASAMDPESDSAGATLARELFRLNEFLLTSNQSLWDETAVVTLIDPSLVSFEFVTVSVQTEDDEAGAISRTADGRTITAAMDADAERVVDAILAGLERGTSTTRIKVGD